MIVSDRGVCPACLVVQRCLKLTRDTDINELTTWHMSVDLPVLGSAEVLEAWSQSALWNLTYVLDGEK